MQIADIKTLNALAGLGEVVEAIKAKDFKDKLNELKAATEGHQASLMALQEAQAKVDKLEALRIELDNKSHDLEAKDNALFTVHTDLEHRQAAIEAMENRIKADMATIKKESAAIETAQATLAKDQASFESYKTKAMSEIAKGQEANRIEAAALKARADKISALAEG